MADEIEAQRRLKFLSRRESSLLRRMQFLPTMRPILRIKTAFSL